MDINLAQNMSECIKEKAFFLTIKYINICTGEVKVFDNSIFEIIGNTVVASLGCLLIVGVLITIVALVWKMLDEW